MQKTLITFLIIIGSLHSHSQKIIQDEIKPISGKRIISTSLLPVFQMKAIQVAAMFEASQNDSIFSLAFYQLTYPTQTDLKADTTKLSCTILLEDQTKITGNYISSTEAAGYKIMKYVFSPDQFYKLSEKDAAAYSLGLPQGIAEYSLTKWYKQNIKKVCSLLLKRISKLR